MRPTFREVSVTELSRLPAGLPVPEDDGAAAHLRGKPMPDLTFPSTSGHQVSFDQRQPARTVLYVYPMTGRPDTPRPSGWDEIPGARGCTTEACDFRDHHSELLDAGVAQVYGLSSQPSSYQREAVDRLNLPFDLLSDSDLSLAERLGLPTFQLEGSRLYKRLTLVISNSSIEHVFYPVFPPNEHAQQVLGWIGGHQRAIARGDAPTPQ